MTDEKNILLPSPIIDAKEDDSIKKLCERYEKLITHRNAGKSRGESSRG